jgi:hypothetical protein
MILPFFLWVLFILPCAVVIIMNPVIMELLCGLSVPFLPRKDIQLQSLEKYKLIIFFKDLRTNVKSDIRTTKQYNHRQRTKPEQKKSRNMTKIPYKIRHTQLTQPITIILWLITSITNRTCDPKFPRIPTPLINVNS